MAWREDAEDKSGVEKEAGGEMAMREEQEEESLGGLLAPFDGGLVGFRKRLVE